MCFFFLSRLGDLDECSKSFVQEPFADSRTFAPTKKRLRIFRRDPSKNAFDPTPFPKLPEKVFTGRELHLQASSFGLESEKTPNFVDSRHGAASLVGWSMALSYN
jgi:hypothetical protein